MARVCAECGRRFDDDAGHCPHDGSPTIVMAAQDDLIGVTIDKRFVVKELLGQGGMGAVYRAYQLSMDRDVALKVLRRDLAGDEQAVRRFFREARAASRLKNPHTITVFDFGQADGGQLYITMEMLTGHPLGREALPMAPDRAVRVVDQVLDSLVEAHGAGVLHRDLKPDNIFVLAGAGTTDFVKVLDFGIAKIQGVQTTNLTGTGMAFGTPSYMSPEQAQGNEVDARSDLYSVGVILFELLAGRLPFDAPTPLALMLKKIQEPAPRVVHVNPDIRIPASLDLALARLLATSVGERPAGAAEAKALLATALSEATGPMVRPATVEIRGGVTTRKVRATPDVAGASEARTLPVRVPAAARTGAWRWLAVAGGAVVLAGAAVAVVASSTGEPPAAPEAAPAPAAVPDPGPAPVAPAASPDVPPAGLPDLPAPAPDVPAVAAAPDPGPAAPAPKAHRKAEPKEAPREAPPEPQGGWLKRLK